MPRKNNRLKHCRRIDDIRNYQRIGLTRHVIERAKSRREDLRGLSDNKIRSKLIHEINHSKVIGIHGREEHRTFNGHIYVVKREADKLVAITYLLSEKRKERKKVNNKYIA